ncbi:MAG: ATP-binding protein, partial [Candidatus Omnitrophota bacterium]
IISHEFKNELCVIQNAVYFLGMKLQNGDEKIKKQIKLLTEEIAETGRMIDNIASFAKNRFLEIKPVNLEALLISAIKKAQIPDTINVLAKIEKDLPPVKADEIQLARVFNNIILNSLQAMTEKGSLIIKAIRLDNGVNIVFEDTGSGIKEEDTKKIFDPFFSTKNKGMGLGLVASKVIIEAHNGSIDITNNKTGKGAMVTIQLPIKERKNA